MLQKRRGFLNCYTVNKLYRMDKNISSHRHHRRHSSRTMHHKRVHEEITMKTLFRFARNHKTLAMIIGVAITVFLSMYVFTHMIAPSE